MLVLKPSFLPNLVFLIISKFQQKTTTLGKTEGFSSIQELILETVTFLSPAERAVPLVNSNQLGLVISGDWMAHAWGEGEELGILFSLKRPLVDSLIFAHQSL